MFFSTYLAFCALVCFLPVEAYLSRLFPAMPKALPSRGAILVWRPWLSGLLTLIFFSKGFLLGLAGILFLADAPLFIFLGFMLALISEAYSPLKKNRHILALGLGFLTIYQPPAFLLYGLIFCLLLALIHYRVPALISAAGLYAILLIPSGNSYQTAAALVLFILLCIYYLEQLRAYFDGQAKNILEEIKPELPPKKR